WPHAQRNQHPYPPGRTSRVQSQVEAPPARSPVPGRHSPHRAATSAGCPALRVATSHCWAGGT
ncbi:MAG: hypothetical protein AVDCRST_MAG77-1095, partial [uncultured Chloroflexi bacterium]